MTEQYYLRARYYIPVLGRFLQEDVYRGDGLNLYAYCGNNPVVYCEPSGYAGTQAQSGTGCPKAELAGDGSGDSGESRPINSQDYLKEALKQQGIDTPGAKFKQKWSDGEYNYEVQVHEGESQYTSAESIYRVSRKKFQVQIRLYKAQGENIWEVMEIGIMRVY